MIAIPQPQPETAAALAQSPLSDLHEGIALILGIARSLGVELVLLADSKSSPSSGYTAINRSIHGVDVTVRGVNVRTGQIEWQGRAHYPEGIDPPADALTMLVCQALATAWGFRPGGQLAIPSKLMCTAGQTESMVSP
jgi:hypothetical protein